MDLVFAPSQVESWPIARLRPYARNAKMHGDDQVAKIAASMARFGWTMPCMVADDGELTDHFLGQVQDRTAYHGNPLFAAIHEAIYAQNGHPTDWAAERVLGQFPAFAASVRPLLLTGETIHPFLFDEVGALRPFRAAAHALARGERPLEVHLGAGFVGAEARAVQRFAHHVRGEGAVSVVHHRQAHPVHGDRVAGGGILGDLGGAHGDPDGVVKQLQLLHHTDFLNESRKHLSPFL